MQSFENTFPYIYQINRMPKVTVDYLIVDNIQFPCLIDYGVQEPNYKDDYDTDIYNRNFAFHRCLLQMHKYSWILNNFHRYTDDTDIYYQIRHRKPIIPTNCELTYTKFFKILNISEGLKSNDLKRFMANYFPYADLDYDDYMFSPYENNDTY